MSGQAPTDIERVEAGIAPYSREREILRRLLRQGPFTSSEFDAWFKPIKRGRRRRIGGAKYLTEDTFILGMSEGRITDWGVMLELLQIMVSLGEASCATNEDGEVVYSEAKS